MRIGVPKEVKTHEYRVGLVRVLFENSSTRAKRSWWRPAPGMESGSLTRFERLCG
jgi:hypothetical protein